MQLMHPVLRRSWVGGRLKFSSEWPRKRRRRRKQEQQEQEQKEWPRGEEQEEKAVIVSFWYSNGLSKYDLHSRGTGIVIAVLHSWFLANKHKLFPQIEDLHDLDLDLAHPRSNCTVLSEKLTDSYKTGVKLSSTFVNKTRDWIMPTQDQRQWRSNINQIGSQDSLRNPKVESSSCSRQHVNLNSGGSDSISVLCSGSASLLIRKLT